MTKETAKWTLATLLNSRETVLQALQRLGPFQKSGRWLPSRFAHGFGGCVLVGSKKRKNRGTKRKQAHMNGNDEAAPEQTAEQKEQFEKITEAADFLMRIGEVDVYSEMKEEFIPEEELLAQRQAAAPRARVTFADSPSTAAEQEGKSEEKPPQEVMWEYKGADGQIHGPFPTSSFVAWQQQVGLPSCLVGFNESRWLTSFAALWCRRATSKAIAPLKCGKSVEVTVLVDQRRPMQKHRVNRRRSRRSRSF